MNIFSSGTSGPQIKATDLNVKTEVNNDLLGLFDENE